MHILCFLCICCILAEERNKKHDLMMLLYDGERLTRLRVAWRIWIYTVLCTSIRKCFLLFALPYVDTDLVKIFCAVSFTVWSEKCGCCQTRNIEIDPRLKNPHALGSKGLNDNICMCARNSENVHLFYVMVNLKT